MAAAAPLKSSKPAPKKTAKPAPKIPITSIKAVPGPSAVPVTAGPVIKLSDAAASKDPRLKKVLVKLEKSAHKTRQHPPASKKAAEAQAAAKPPANEKLAAAQANQVDTMKEVETKKPEPESFLTLMRAEIEKVMPKTLGDTEKFMKGEKKDQLKGSMTGNVNKQKEEATGGIKSAATQAPDTSRIPGKEVTSIPPEPIPSAPPPLGASEGMPAPKPANEVSLEKSKQDADKQLTDANVTTEQLQKANDPRFSAVLTAKSAVVKQADAAPQKYCTDEQKTLAQAANNAVADEKKGLTAFLGVKGLSMAKVKSRQQMAKEKDEAERKKVADTIEHIYKKTKESVEKKLSSLETEVSAKFDQGMEAALKKMTDYIDDRMFKWKLARYGSSLGLLWLKDKLLGLPDEVNVFYETGRKIFTQELDRTITDIAKLVDTRLKEAKDEISKGQKEISDYVKGLPQNLQAVGKTAEKDMAGRFDELRQSVDDKKNDLAQNLAQRYKEANDKANEKLKEMQAENKGLLTRLKETIGEVVKILREFKARIMGMLKQGEGTIMLIVADPIGFLKNLLNAIKKGISQFVDRIWEHLKAGFMAWLFGSLAETGVEVPKDFSLGSILKLVLQVLGLTYERIRAKAIKLIGERNVALLEKAFELIKALITGGPEKLWEMMKEYLGNLKEMIINAVQEWVVTTVIKAAVTKLISMFNPVGAIIQAILAIYNTVMFFIERIRQILDFVEAIISSVFKIATGAIDAAANWIEKALARTIPLIIAFLARLLGLTGITEKIVGIIKKIQSKVDQVVDKVIGKIVGGIGKIIGKGKAAVASVVKWWKQKKPFKTKGGEAHSIFYSGEEKNAIAMVASKDPKPIAKKVDEFDKQASSPNASEAEKKGKSLIASAKNAEKKDPNDPNLVIYMKELFETYNEGGADKETKITRKTGRLGGDTVGLEMTVDWLGPKHKQGSPPQSGVQSNLMGLLITDPGEKSADKYIRGHLLNEHLGGEGDAKNMFPITGNANSQHLHSTETKVKGWMSKPKRWVKYEVKVQRISSKLDGGPKSWDNYVNSTFVCYAILKDTAGKVEEEFTSSIPSIFEKKGKAQVTKIGPNTR